MLPDKFSIKGSLSMAWGLSKQHWLVLTGLYLTFSIITMLISLLAFGKDYHSVQYWISQLIVAALSLVFYVGYYKMYLNAVDGEEPEFSTFSQGLNRIIPYLLTSLLTGLIIVAGFVLLILPGFYLMVRLQFGAIIAIDKQVRPIEAIKESWELTKGKFWPIFGLLWIQIGITILGVLAFIVGVFFALVMVAFATVCAYRILQNEYLKKINSTTEFAELKD